MTEVPDTSLSGFLQFNSYLQSWTGCCMVTLVQRLKDHTSDKTQKTLKELDCLLAYYLILFLMLILLIWYLIYLSIAYILYYSLNSLDFIDIKKTFSLSRLTITEELSKFGFFIVIEGLNYKASSSPETFPPIF